MFYAARGQHPAQAPHPASRAGRLALRRGAVRRRGLHRPIVAALPPRPADADAPDRGGGRGAPARGGRRRLPPSPPDRRGRASSRAATPITGRIPLFFNSDIVMGVVRPAEAMAETVFYRNGEADELLYVHEGSGLLDTVFGPIRYGPGDYLVLPIGTTWRLVPDDGQHAADALSRVPVGDRGAEALSQRLRPAARALAVLAARHPAARRGRRLGPTRASSRSRSRCATG